MYIKLLSKWVYLIILHSILQENGNKVYKGKKMSQN